MHEDLLRQLASMPDEVESAIARIPPEYLTWKPASWGGSLGDMFSPVEHACHLRDIEIDGYQVRIHRMLEEDHPSLESIDGDVLARERAYEKQDVREALRSFRRARERTIEIVRGLDERASKRTGTFAEYGEITLGGLVHYLRGHDHAHLGNLSWLLGKLSSGG